MTDFARPFTAFNFRVNLQIPGAKNFVCNAEFSECDGLEMNLELKTLRQGGDNGRQIHLVGPVGYGQLTLKRGMTDSFGLWDWFKQVRQDHKLRASGEVLMLSSDRTKKKNVRFSLTGCLPVKLKAPSFNALSGQVAIEEMQIAYETLEPKLLGG